MPKRIGVVGGGIAGLVAAYELSKAGAHVTVLERETKMGGLARSFVVEPGVVVERYHHFICKPDKLYLEMVAELGLAARVRWVATQMGFYHACRLSPIGDPLSMLRSPHFSLGQKMRLAMATAGITLGDSSGWKRLEDVPAPEWLVRRYGPRVYRVLYEPLLRLKFHEYAPRISAAWMWARFHRLGKSRTPTQKEQLGYLGGGTQVYIDALESALFSRGADLQVSAAVDEVIIDGARAIGVRCAGELRRFDAILVTVPIPSVRSLLRGADASYLRSLERVAYIDVVAVAMRLKRSFSKYFWLNVSDPDIDLPGIVEYTNLNPRPDLGGDAIVYMPQYAPAKHRVHGMSDLELFDKNFGLLRTINPEFDRRWVRRYWVHRDKFAQPICDMGFSRHTPPMRTPIADLYLTDSSQLHPYDRSISGSTALGKRAAQLILGRA